jgi:hypothetical protein
MRKMSIYRNIEDPNNAGKILRKETLRSVNLHADFEGFGENGAINNGPCKELADALEPGNDGYEIL